MVAFSRLQLAAALLEYDNDPNDPNAPKRSAYDSAIFSYLRRNNGDIHALTQPSSSRKSGYLDVMLPSEAGGTSEKPLARISKASIDMLHNPFYGDEAEELEEDLEVDLASWGLDSLMPKEANNSKSSKGKERAGNRPDGRFALSVHVGPASGKGHNVHVRSASAPMDQFSQANDSSLLAQGHRRSNTVSDPLGLTSSSNLEVFDVRRKVPSLTIDRRGVISDSAELGDNQDTIPFPSVTDARVSAIHRPTLRAEGLSVENNDNRHSLAGSLSPHSRASLFHPQYGAHSRRMSNARELSEGPETAYQQDTENPALSNTTALNIKPRRDRRISTATYNTRDLLDDEFDDDHEWEERERRYSRLELMRPKVLVMPSPLQNAYATRPQVPSSTPREGFLDSTDGRPLPPGARSTGMSAINAPVAANSFTPNPRLNLSATQLLFRNNLLVDGQRDVAYDDIDGQIKRALADGEKIEFESAELEEPITPVESKQASRPVGRLYGTSLIDALEARKAEIRGKQRVFQGDERPSMMQRGQTNRSSTLIDPASLQQKPSGLRQTDTSRNNTDLARHSSRNSQPLLAFDESGHLSVNGDGPSKLHKAHSVFGVDTIWEREMVKLKEIEEQEKQEQQEQREHEDTESKKRKKKKGKKGKKGKDRDELEGSNEGGTGIPPSPRDAVFAPEAPLHSLALPDIPVVTSHRYVATERVDEDSDNESSTSRIAPKLSLNSKAVIEKAADNWIAEDEMPGEDRRKTLVVPPIQIAAGADDSDEDLPLSVALNKLSIAKAGGTDSDEDRPLSMLLLDKPKLGLPGNGSDTRSPSCTNGSSNALYAGRSSDDDDDDVPLGVRASRVPHLSGSSNLGNLNRESAADDDDRPLSMHPSQAKKMQFQMFAQMQQQQQQQMFMANQMAFAPPPSMMLMMPPSASFAPLASVPMQIQDSNKYSSVDRWRHDVAVEGQP